MKKAGILLAVLAAAILLKTQVWDRHDPAQRRRE